MIGTEQMELDDLTQQILDEAKHQGATAAEAGSSIENGYSTSVRMGEVETIEHHKDRGMVVTVYFGNRKGTASTSDFSVDAVRAAVRAACDIARHTQEDEYAGLADPARLATELPDLELEHGWDVGVEESIDVARACESAALESDDRIKNSEGGAVSSHHSIRVYGNSNGFLAGYGGTRHGISCSVVATDQSGMQRDYWSSSARDPRQLESAEEVGKKSAKRAVDRLGGMKVATGEAPVLFAAPVAGSLLGHLLSAIRGGNIYRKASFLLDRLGERIFPDFITIYERPHLHGGSASAAFDSEGVKTEDNSFVTDGVLSSYVLDSYAARRLGMETTGNGGGVRNLRVTHGDVGLDGMLSKMDRGLLVTEMMGHGVNAITGDYSRGASGFWVEGGKIVHPVDEITIAGNLRNMFSQIVAVGDDVDPRGNIQTGSILLENMSIAGE